MLCKFDTIVAHFCSSVEQSNNDLILILSRKQIQTKKLYDSKLRMSCKSQSPLFYQKYQFCPILSMFWNMLTKNIWRFYLCYSSWIFSSEGGLWYFVTYFGQKIVTDILHYFGWVLTKGLLSLISYCWLQHLEQ